MLMVNLSQIVSTLTDYSIALVQSAILLVILLECFMILRPRHFNGPGAKAFPLCVSVIQQCEP